jgi:hypothetical protein
MLVELTARRSAAIILTRLASLSHNQCAYALNEPLAHVSPWRLADSTVENNPRPLWGSRRRSAK